MLIYILQSTTHLEYCIDFQKGFKGGGIEVLNNFPVSRLFGQKNILSKNTLYTNQNKSTRI